MHGAPSNGGVWLRWLLAILAGAGAGIFSAGARIQSFESRLSILKSDGIEVRRQASTSRLEVLSQLKRIEISLAELRAEQRILHGR